MSKWEWYTCILMSYTVEKCLINEQCESATLYCVFNYFISWISYCHHCLVLFQKLGRSCTIAWKYLGWRLETYAPRMCGFRILNILGYQAIMGSIHVLETPAYWLTWRILKSWKSQIIYDTVKSVTKLVDFVPHTEEHNVMFLILFIYLFFFSFFKILFIYFCDLPLAIRIVLFPAK